MPQPSPTVNLEQFTTFGDLLRFLRRRAGMTQRELAIEVGYGDAQISRLEQNQRLPDLAIVSARLIPALDLDSEAAGRLLALASGMRRDDAPASGVPPFMGLRYFDEADSDLFFGREALVTQLVNRLQTAPAAPHQARFLAVVGASGSGKSSIVRAGLIPALRWSPALADWAVHSLTPADHPLQSLAAAVLPDSSPSGAVAALAADCIRSPSALADFVCRPAGDDTSSGPANCRQRLLVVDQFEEVFTLCRDESERRAFIDNLVTAASEPKAQLFIVLTLRADFYAHCAPYALLRDVISSQQVYIGPMSAEELRRSIEAPAKRTGWELEPGLADLLLRDIGSDGPHPAEPGALPLLSHALLETWHRRRGRALTVSGYLASGGVRGAIAETAEAVFHDELDTAQRVIARNIFLRLTELGEDNAAAETRRRATFEELISNEADAAAVRYVLTRLADARLITTEAGSAEVAHEALIREWPTLRGWLEADRDALRLHRHLTLAAEGWAERGRDPGELYRGARLVQVVEWAGAHSNDLNARERTFLEAAQALAERESAEREAQRQQELEAAHKLTEVQRRAAAQLRGRALLLAGAFVVALLLAGTALVLGQQARQAAERAQAASRVATSRELAAAAISSLSVDPERGILLALQAATVTHTLEAEDALHRTLQASRVQRTLAGHSDGVNRVAYSPDGRRLATTSDDGTARVWDAATGESLVTLSGHDTWAMGVAFSPDGQRLASSMGETGRVVVSDAGTGQALFELERANAPVWGVAFSPDGSRLATGTADGQAAIWDAATGSKLLSLLGHDGGIWNVAFSPDGARLATASFDRTAKIWDAATGRQLFSLEGHGDVVRGVAFSPDGRLLATSSDDNAVRIWDTTSGLRVLTLSGHTSTVLDVAFSPDGSLLASASGDRRVIVWRLAYNDEGALVSGQEWLVLSGHDGVVSGLAFHPDGTRIATASSDGTARIWDISPEGGRELLALTGPRAQTNSIALSPDGRRFATSGNDGARIWDAATGQEIAALTGQHAPVGFAAFSPDGTRLATAALDPTAMVWDAATGEALLKLEGHTDILNSIVFSPDGTRIATASRDGSVSIWDAADGRRLLNLDLPDDEPLVVAFSPDGSRLATAGRGGIPKVWDAATGKLLAALDHPTSFTDQTWRIWGLAFSPDGSRLAATSQEGPARVWDLKTGQELLSLVGHAGATVSVQYSPDGSRLATGSRDGTARLWDAATGQTLLVLEAGTGGGLNGAVFDRTGTRLATGGDNGVRIYALPIDELMAIARTRVTRGLTTEECQAYLHQPVCP